MDRVDNNQFEVKPTTSKRKIAVTCPNVYLNPALDLLANEDRICNTAMEIPMKKRKRSKSCDVMKFENSALDLGVKPVNEILLREIDNVRRNVKNDLATVNPIDSNDRGKGFKNIDEDIDDVDFVNTAEDSNVFDDTKNNDINLAVDSKLSLITEPLYSNFDQIQSRKALETPVSMVKPINKEIKPLPIETEATEDTKESIFDGTDISRIDDNYVDSGISVQEQNTNRAEFSNISNITNIQSNVTNQVIVNNTNLSLSFIDRLALDSPNTSERSLFFDDDLNESNIMEIKTITIITKKKRIIEKKNTNPFLNPNLDMDIEIPKHNPFLDIQPDTEENIQEETVVDSANNAMMPRRLFDTNSTISTVNESSIESQHEYENIDMLQQDHIYENIEELNKQSKILGFDVSQFNSIDIMNNKTKDSNDSQDSKKEKHSFFKPGKLSKKVFKTLKRTFKHDKTDTDVTLNPYEVPRKPPKTKSAPKESGIENPALNLDNSDDLEFEELSDEEHQYETIKTIRNTRLNMNVTPLKERNDDVDVSGRTNTPGKKVRFDSTLNREKVITGTSFDCGVVSPGFDSKIEKYHDELENCINERKFLQQNM